MAPVKERKYIERRTKVATDLSAPTTWDDDDDDDVDDDD